MCNPYQEIVTLLKTNNISYSDTEHEPVYTSAQAAKIRGISASQGAKALLLKGENGFILALLPGDHKLDSKKLKKLLGIKELRFAFPEEVKNIMGCEIGACYPFGTIIRLPTYADNLLSANDTISFNPGIHTHSIEMRWQDFYSLVKPKMVDISVR